MAKAKRRQHIEYRLLIEHTHDETLNKHGILFLLETTKQFTNFSYVIDVKEELKGNMMTWSLRGLRAPSMNMPETGTARFTKVYFKVPKNVTFTISKKDHARASTEITFTASAIAVSDSKINFLKIYTDRKEFENKRSADTVPPEHKPDLHRAPADAAPFTQTKKKA